MNYIFIITSIVLPCIYFSIGVLFFKGIEFRYFDNFIDLNKYIFYITSFFSIFASKIFKHINIKLLNNKIKQGFKYAIRLQNIIVFLMTTIFFINLVSLFWFIVFNFK